MYYNEKTEVYLNGQWLKANEAKASLFDQTLHYGNGVFEGIRSYQTPDGVRIFKAREHYERLLYSAEKMHIQVPYTVDQLIEISYSLLERNNLGDAYIRPLVFLGPDMRLEPVQEVHVFLCAWEWSRYLGDKLLKVGTSSYRRPDPRSCHVEAKTVGHYTNSILATTEAKKNGFDEALLLDGKGYVAEGSGANFFYQKEDVLYTCPLGNILPGITRQTIIDLASELGFKVQEKYFTPQDVYGSQGAFFTGTAAEVAGIESLDDHQFELPWQETLGAELSAMYTQLVSQNQYKNFSLV